MKRSAKPQPGHLEQKIDHVFNNPSLLQEALTHSSYFHEHSSGARSHNERLEFLGDAVVGMIIVEYLYLKNHHLKESTLAKMKSHLVSEPVLAGMAQTLALGQHLLLGKGEAATGGAGKQSILADCFEAVVGALYLDAGYDETRSIMLKIFRKRIDEIIEGGDFFDYKTELQELTQKRFGMLPEYRVIKESGEEHQRVFTVAALLDGKKIATASGRRKKEAESRAARKAIARLEKDSTGS